MTNIYITGLNQITDIEIDKINKPFLPLASNKLKVREAKIIITFSLGFSILLSLFLDFFLLLTIILSIIVGTLYSVNPFRFKKVPILASLSIIGVRGLIVNIGIYIAFRNLFSYPSEFNNGIIILTVFITIISVSIALIKDIPDFLGDKEYKISTLPILIGRKSVFVVAVSFLIMIYLIIIVFSILFVSEIKMIIFGFFHLLILLYLLFRIKNTDYNENNSIKSFYYFIWKLFYLEYIIIPLILISF